MLLFALLLLLLRPLLLWLLLRLLLLVLREALLLSKLLSLMVGLLSGLLAAAGASAAGYLLARFVLEIDYGFDPLVWVVGLFGGALLVAASGWIATRSVVRQPPIATLRAN